MDVPVELPNGTVVEIRPVNPPPRKHHPDVERFAGILESVNISREDYYEYIRKKHS
jgi:hypothetical protein